MLRGRDQDMLPPAGKPQPDMAVLEVVGGKVQKGGKDVCPRQHRHIQPADESHHCQSLTEADGDRNEKSGQDVMDRMMAIGRHRGNLGIVERGEQPDEPVLQEQPKIQQDRPGSIDLCREDPGQKALDGFQISHRTRHSARLARIFGGENDGPGLSA